MNAVDQNDKRFALLTIHFLPDGTCTRTESAKPKMARRAFNKKNTKRGLQRDSREQLPLWHGDANKCVGDGMKLGRRRLSYCSDSSSFHYIRGIFHNSKRVHCES